MLPSSRQTPSQATYASCIYEGTIHHRRTSPAKEFRHPIALGYLDLAELGSVLGGRLQSHWPGALRFRRRDHLPSVAGIDLATAARTLVEARTGHRPAGPVRLLAAPSSFGLCFNPVSFLYCLSPGEDRIEAIIAEVTNTPWRERHQYVLQDPRGSAGTLHTRFEKELHVSPFMGMEHEYQFSATTPGGVLTVRIASHRSSERVFDATLSLRRRELDRAAARRYALRFPVASLRVLALIYGHAIGLRLAGAPTFPHPRRAEGPQRSTRTRPA